MSKIISSIPSIRYTADVAYQLEPNITVQGTLKYADIPQEKLLRSGTGSPP